MTPVSFPQDRQESNQGELEGRSSTPATPHRDPPSFAADVTPLRLRPPRALGKLWPASLMLLRLISCPVVHSSSGNTSAGEAQLRRAAAVLDGAAQSPTEPRKCLRWFTHGA